MSLLTWIILFCLLGGILSVIAAASFLLLPGVVRSRVLPHFVSFAIGALLGAAFLALLPHALSAPGIDDPHDITMVILLGIMGFFMLEKMVLWRHCHSEVCEAHVPAEHNHQASGTLVLIGDGLHNFVDGILIAAAFMVDVELGIVTALAVAAHEIPQEVGDFAILLQSGFSRGRAFFFNVLASLTTVVGGVLAYFTLSSVTQIVPYILAIAASSFIYVAMADLLPGLHKRTQLSETVKQLILIAAGVVIIFIAHSTLH
ncbi:MAG: ZIP family metal transporter [Gammaproteobacteria bacterium]|nr:ZIP family metal transporter [Gammaproteobacteria bacterium]